MYNLRNRSFLKEIDFTTGELQHLLTLSAALKTVKYAGTDESILPAYAVKEVGGAKIGFSMMPARRVSVLKRSSIWLPWAASVFHSYGSTGRPPMATSPT